MIHLSKSSIISHLASCALCVTWPAQDVIGPKLLKTKGLKARLAEGWSPLHRCVMLPSHNFFFKIFLDPPTPPPVVPRKNGGTIFCGK